MGDTVDCPRTQPHCLAQADVTRGNGQLYIHCPSCGYREVQHESTVRYAPKHSSSAPLQRALYAIL